MIMESNIWQIVLLSLRVAGIAIIIALPLAFLVGWLLARFHFPGKSLVQAIVTMPLVLPPVVTGYPFDPVRCARAIGSALAGVAGPFICFPMDGAALAAGVMAFPLLVRPIRLSIEGLDRGLEEAARTLGASRFTAFYRYSAAAFARHSGGRGAGLCQGAGRVWRYDHLCFQYSG
ncbi:ABC transporter permease subunit [Brucella suis bv. 1]|nr:ABC transporter permease subunit [Brucella suis bv. 1]